MRKDNRRFFNTMIMGVTAIFMACCFNNAHAKEVTIYKCTCPNGKILFQDLICPQEAKIETLKIELNQSADNPVGLREQEKAMLANSQQRLAQEKDHHNKITVARLNKEAALLTQAPKTEVHVHPVQTIHYLNTNQNQNSVNIQYNKIKK